MRNPNAYNDAAYAVASSDLLASLPALLDALWEAGADLDNIATELGEAFANCESELAGGVNCLLGVASPRSRH
jgi:hypothetical protein